MPSRSESLRAGTYWRLPGQNPRNERAGAHGPRGGRRRAALNLTAANDSTPLLHRDRSWERVTFGTYAASATPAPRNRRCASRRDRYSTDSDADFRLGLEAAQTTLGAIAMLPATLVH